MNMNTGSDSNNINYSSSKKENVNTSSISTGKQFVKDSIEQYNNTSNYGSVPEIESMDLSFATEQLEENKNTLTNRLKSFFNSLLGKEDETSSSVTTDVQSRVDVSMDDTNDDVEVLDENVMPEFDGEVFHPFRGNDNFYNNENGTSSIFVGNSSNTDDNVSEVFHPFRGNDNFYNNSEADGSSIFIGDTADNNSEADYSSFVETCQVMIDAMDAEIANKEKEFYEKYGDNSNSIVDFRVTYEDEFNSTQQAIQNMLDQLEDMLPIEYINEYCVEAYGGEGITYDALVSLYNAALNGDQEAHNRFTEIMRGGFSKLQNVDSSYTDESVNYLMESEVNGLFENIVDKITYINNLVAPAVQMAQEIRALKDARNNMFMYSHAYILELPEVKEYTTEELLQYLTEDQLKLMDASSYEANIYVYLMKNGRVDNAAEYLSLLQDKMNQRQGMIWAREEAEKILSSDGDWWYDLWVTTVSGNWGGLVNFAAGFENLFNPDGIVSSEQYKQQFLMTMMSSNTDLESIKTQYGEDSEEYRIYKKMSEINYNWLLSFDYQLSLSSGNMWPSMLLTAATKWIPVVGDYIGPSFMFASSMGNSVETAYQKGSNGFDAYLYGALMGLSEVSLEKFVGGIPFLSDASGFTFRAIFGEGVEEALQTFIEAGGNAIFFGEEIDWAATGVDSLKALGFGCFMSFCMNGGNLTINLGVNGMKTITSGEVKNFMKVDSDGNPYFDAFAFGEYIQGLASSFNGNATNALEHNLNAGTINTMKDSDIQTALQSMDSDEIYMLLTNCDVDTRKILLSNMDALALNNIVNKFGRTTTGEKLLSEFEAIQKDAHDAEVKKNRAEQKNNEASTILHGDTDVFNVDFSSINTVEDLELVLNSVDLSNVDMTNSDFLGGLVSINEQLSAKGLPKIGIKDGHFVIDGLDFVSEYKGDTTNKSTPKIITDAIFKLLDLPLSDEMKMKLIENMSDADKVKALEYLKSDGIKYKVVQSIDDLATRYNIFMYLLNDTTNDYLYDVEDDFKKCIMDELITFNSRELTDFLKKLKYDSYIRDVYYLINGNDDFIGMFISCIPNLSLKAEMLLSYDNYNKCSVDVIFNILSQLKGDDLLLFDTLNKLFFSSSKEDSFNYGLSTDLLNVSSNSELTTYIEAFIEYSYLSLEEKNSKSIFDTFVRKYGFEFSILFSFELFDNYTLEFLKSNYTFINCLSDINTQRQIKKMLCEYILGAESNEFKIFDSFIDDNPFILDNINCEILSSDIISGLGFDRVKEMVMYPDIQQKVLDIYNTDKEKFGLFCEVINNISSYSQNVLFQPYIDKLFGIFLTPELNSVLSLIGNNYNDINKPDEIINLILSMSTNNNEILESCLKNVSSVDDLNNLSRVYYEKLNSEYQDIYNKSNKTKEDIIKIKDLFLLNLFGISFEEANNLVSQYKYLDIAGLLDEDSLFIYKVLSDVCKINDLSYFPDHLMDTDTKDVFKYYDSAYILEQSIKNVYSQRYMEKAYKIEDNTPSEYRNVNVIDKKGNILIYQIPIYELDDDSILLIHKKDAFSSGNTSANNYVEQYNTPPDNDKAKQHHLSTSVISKDEGNIAMSSMPGLIYGYSNWDVESFVTMSNGDIYSESKYKITWRREANYMSSSELLDQTKNYNEIVFDRNGIKPSYMILTDDMSPDLVQKTYQAAYDWGIPIVCR